MLFFILQIAGVLAVFQTVLLMLFFNSTKNRNRSNVLLSLILLVYTMQICAIEFMSSFPDEILVKYNLFPAICNQFAFLFGPLLWLYSRSIISIKPGRHEWLHFTPFALMIIFMTVKKSVEPDYLFWFSPFRFYSSGLILIHGLVYILATGVGIFRNMGLYRKYVDQSPGFKTLYAFLLAGFIALWVLKFNTFLFLDIWRRYHLCPFTTSLYFIAGFLFFNILVYLSLIRPELFTWKKKYRNAKLTEEKKHQIISEVLRQMEVEKIYSDSSLTLSFLAKKTGIPLRFLSQIINEEFKVSFSEFVNAYRIKEAECLLLNNGDEFTVQQIMYDVGFNSKSAFHTAFRKYCGCTPKELQQKAVAA
jgi:AraC-like DNA-binding protein